MANDATGNPWILDSAAVITTNMVNVQGMEYHPNAVDNDLIVKDCAGTIKWQTRAIAPSNAHQSSGKETWEFGPTIFNGFDLATIDGGTLYVHIR